MDNADSSQSRYGNLGEFDYVYISALGSIEGKESKLCDFIDCLNHTPAKVVNDPETMRANFDKGYLLQLQEQGIDVVPTDDGRYLSFSDLERFEKWNDGLVLKPRLFGERSNGVVKSSDLVSKESFDNYKSQYGGAILVQPFLKGIVENGERSFVYVGKDFSHGIYRHRADWQFVPGTANRTIIEPTDKELETIKNIFDVWPTKYHVSRFDFIPEGGKPMVSEVEMVNPNVWLGRGIKTVDETFPRMLADYLLKMS